MQLPRPHRRGEWPGLSDSTPGVVLRAGFSYGQVVLLTAERIVIDGVPRPGMGIAVDSNGRIARVDELERMGQPDVSLRDCVVLPGWVNAHSHAFQRLLRGRTQAATVGEDSFWTWRRAMYQVASSLEPDGLRIAARQMFIEMLLSGVTCVGEFHYLHHQPNGDPYNDPAAMSEALALAASDAGIRIAVLRTVYLTGDFQQEPSDLQRRFCDRDLDASWAHLEQVVARLRSLLDPRVTWGVAAHSIRAVPYDAMVALKTCASHLPLHIHVSEQPREVEGCIAVYGAPPVRLMARSGILDAGTTLVHATHLRKGEAELIARQGANVCVCPSTEADLGDGLGPVADLHRRGVPISLGTDGETSSSLLEEARRLEMHERLRLQRRNVLSDDGDVSKVCLRAATLHGAQALQIPAGDIEPGRWADLVAYDLADPSLAGATDASLLPSLVFSADSRAVRHVMVGGRWVVQEGEHPSGIQSAEAFGRLTRETFG